MTERGLAKKKGGVGKKTTGITNRTFKPNIQRVRAVVDGRVVRLKVAAKFLRRGMVVKPPRRQMPEAAAPEASAS
jgi:large subunit ribosomal protein L28